MCLPPLTRPTRPTDPEAHHAAAGALADLVGERRVQGLLVEKVNGEPVLAPEADSDQAAVVAALTAAGFARTPRGLRLR